MSVIRKGIVVDGEYSGWKVFVDDDRDGETSGYYLYLTRKRGQIYFLILGYAESFHGGGIKYAQDGTYCYTELPTPYRTTRS